MVDLRIVVHARRSTLFALAFGGLALVLVIATPPGAGAAPVEPGETVGRLRLGTAAPRVDASRLSGTDDPSLDALRGRVIILDFWATWCGPCRAVMPELDALSRRHHAAGLSVIGIASEAEAVLRAHIPSSPVSYTIARDTGATHSRSGVRALPMLVVIDKAGRVRDVQVGVDGASRRRLEGLVVRRLAE